MSHPGFRITSKKGFHTTFENGYTVSVQFGPGNYCDGYSSLRRLMRRCGEEIGRDNEEWGARGNSTAEVAVWQEDQDLIAHPSFNGDTVGGYHTPAQVLELLNWAASQSKET